MSREPLRRGAPPYYVLASQAVLVRRYGLLFLVALELRPAIYCWCSGRYFGCGRHCCRLERLVLAWVLVVIQPGNAVASFANVNIYKKLQ